MKPSQFLLAAVVTIFPFATEVAAQSESATNYLWKQCNEDVLELHLDPEPFDEVLGSQFSMALEEGKARVLIIVQDCSQYWIDGEDLGPTQHAHVWVSIDGPQDVVTVVGAQHTLPTATWFSLSAGSNNPRDREARMASGTGPAPIDEVSLDRAASQRGGEVALSEDRGYSWETSPVARPAGVVGVNHVVYVRDPLSRTVVKRIQALGPVAGPSEGTLEVVGGIDPSRLIGTGTYPVSVYSFFPIWARATLGEMPSK